MSTRKPIGTISYNSSGFLVKTFDDLICRGWIDDWRAIFHYKETDEKKDHWHLIIFPCRSIDTSALSNLFLEPDPEHPKKPLDCKPWRNSEPLNWLLYVLHDPIYLACHPGKSDGDGKIEYQLDDVYCACREYLEEDYIRAAAIRETSNHKALTMVQNGYSFTEILSMVPNMNPVALNAIFRGVYTRNPVERSPFDA